MKLEQLTPKQVKLQAVVVEEWKNNFFNLKFDQKKAGELIDYAYSLAKLDAPIKIYLDSPFGCQLAYAILKNLKLKDINMSSVWASVWASVRDSVRDSVGDSVWDSVGASVRDSVGASVWDSVWDSVRDSVRDSVGASVWDSVWDSVRDSVGASVRDSVGDSVWDSVGASVRDSVRDSVGDSVWDSVGASVRDSVRDSVRATQIEYQSISYYCDITDYGWVAFYDYFQRIGIDVPESFKKYSDLIKANIFSSLMYNGVCFISRPPINVQRDERGRMHSTTGPAITFKDGYALNFVHGISFQDADFKNFFLSENVDGKEILSVDNAERKAVIIQELGYDKIIKDIGAKVVDKYITKSAITGKPTTCELLEFELNGMKCRVVKVEDHTMHKETFLGVPVEESTSTCKGAIAWTFGLKEEEYNPVLES